MKLSRGMLIAGLALVVWPGPSFGQTETVGRRPVLQTPYGQDKAQTRVDQGNRGRPAMQEPYGQQKDDRRLETGNRGRPTSTTATTQPSPVTRGRSTEQKPEPAKTVEAKPESKKDEKKEQQEAKKEEKKEAKEEKKEDKDEEKDDEAKGHAPLPAPLTIRPSFSVTSSGWSVAVVPENLGGKRYIKLVKGVLWTFAPQARLAGFRVYQQAPGEDGFRLYRVIDLAATRIGSQPYTYEGVTNPDGSSMTLVSYKLATGDIYVSLLDWKTATDWRLGTYQHVVVPYDAKGREGRKSPVVSATNLGEIEVLTPTEGAGLSRMPAFRWSDIWPAELHDDALFRWPAGYGSTEVIVSEPGRGALWHARLNRLTFWCWYWFHYDWTGKRGGYELLPGHQYYFLVHTWGGNATAAYIGYSRLVGFTVK